jgi:hypothetical protein
MRGPWGKCQVSRETDTVVSECVLVPDTFVFFAKLTPLFQSVYWYLTPLSF